MNRTTRPAPAGSPDSDGAHSDPAAEPAPTGYRRRRLLPLVVGIVLAAVLAAILASGLHSSKAPTVNTVGATAPGIDSGSSALMNLNVISPEAARPAPNFDLVDQYGRPTTLSQFRGKVVVWSLNDDQCTDLCTLLAQDVVTAERDLGPAARDVVFVAVNANPFYPSPAAVKAWSDRNALGGLSNWVYVTGSPAQLQSTWNAYHVTVIQDHQARTVQHDASMEFIDPDGQVRALGSFTQGAISTAYYAHAMAQMAVDLLPKDQQVHVAGTSVESASTTGATIGDPAPGFSLPGLSTNQATSLGGLERRPLVVNFWSTTCSVCVQEMPALQKVDADFAGQVNVAGIDVADPRGRSAAASFASRLGVHYPLLSDDQGTVQAAYRVSALPVTFIIGPGGSILARHDGALTETQLIAVLEEDFENLPQIGP